MTFQGYYQVRHPSTVDYEAMKRNGWLDQGALFINIDDDRLSWVERQMIENIGNKIYGERKPPKE